MKSRYILIIDCQHPEHTGETHIIEVSDVCHPSIEPDIRQCKVGLIMQEHGAKRAFLVRQAPFLPPAFVECYTRPEVTPQRGLGT